MMESESSSSKIFVRYKKADPTEDEIRAIFSKHGTISDIKLYSRFCFVEYDSESSAAAAVQAENGTQFKNVTLEVEGVVRNIPKRKADDSEAISSVAASDISKEPSVKMLKQETTNMTKETNEAKDNEKNSRVIELAIKVEPVDIKYEQPAKIVPDERPERRESKSERRNTAVIEKNVSQSKIRTETSEKVSSSSEKNTRSRSPTKDSGRNQSSGNTSSLAAPSASKDYQKVSVSKTAASYFTSVPSNSVHSTASCPTQRSHGYASSYASLASPRLFAQNLQVDSRENSASNSPHVAPVDPGLTDMLSFMQRRDHNLPVLTDSWTTSNEIPKVKASDSVEGSAAWTDFTAREAVRKFSQNVATTDLQAQEKPESRNIDQFSAEKVSRIAEARKMPSPDAYSSSKAAENTEVQSQSYLVQQRNDSSRDVSDAGICEIIVTEPRLRHYALKVASRIHSVGLKVEICDLPAANTIIDEVEEALGRGCLFAVVITDLHAQRNSVTVDILHGIPEEHRNMMIDDAVKLIKESYQSFVSSKQKAESNVSSKPPERSAKSPVTKPTAVPLPNQSLQMLMRRLAERDDLSYEELEELIVYLRRRQEIVRPTPPKVTVSSSMSERDQISRSKEFLDNSAKQKELEATIFGIIKGDRVPAQAQDIPKRTADAVASSYLRQHTMSGLDAKSQIQYFSNSLR